MKSSICHVFVEVTSQIFIKYMQSCYSSLEVSSTAGPNVSYPPCAGTQSETASSNNIAAYIHTRDRKAVSMLYWE